VLLSEALAELNLGESASEDDVRRAYLRLLKTRKPEQDPEGFKRLREAYEVAKAHIASGVPLPIFVPPPPVEPAPPPAVEPAPPPVEPAPPQPSIDELIAKKEFKAAAEATIRLLQLAEARPELVVPSERDLLWLGFRLVERKSYRTAKRLENAIQRWLEFSGPRSGMGGTSVILWSLYRDFVLVGPELSEPVRRAIGRLLRQPDAGFSLDAVNDSDWEAARRDIALMRAKTPSLHNFAAPHIVAAAEDHRRAALINDDRGVRQGGGMPRWTYSLPLTLLLVVLRMVAATGSCSSRSSSYDYSSSYSPTAPSPPPITPRARASASAQIVSLLTCETDPACQYALQTVQDALTAGDCPAARAATDSFKKANRAHIDNVALAEGTLKRFEDSLAYACPPETDAGSNDE